MHRKRCFSSFLCGFSFLSAARPPTCRCSTMAVYHRPFGRNAGSIPAACPNAGVGFLALSPHTSSRPSSDRGRVYIRGCRTTASISAFQAEDGGSIPLIRSMAGQSCGNTCRYLSCRLSRFAPLKKTLQRVEDRGRGTYPLAPGIDSGSRLAQPSGSRILLGRLAPLGGVKPRLSLHNKRARPSGHCRRRRRPLKELWVWPGNGEL